MKRLPLIIIVIISALSLIILLPFMGIQWLLGGDEPFNNYIKAVSSICFDE